MNKKYNQLEKQKNAIKEETKYSILFTLPLTTTLILVLASIIHNYNDLDKLAKILGFIITDKTGKKYYCMLPIGIMPRFGFFNLSNRNA